MWKHICLCIYMDMRMSTSLAELPGVFKALSDPTRLRLLNLLSGGEVCVCFLGEVLGMVQPKVSRHLAYLKKAGLVVARKEGQWMHYTWAKQPHPLARSVLEGLREWMMKNEHLAAERRRLKKCLCG